MGPTRFTLMLLVAISFHAEIAEAQAYCALRDPVKLIYDMFPDANGYQSIVRKIDRDVAARVEEAVPFPLHRAELGKHTLYVATRAGEPLGFVHVRSERSRWGLVEVAWGLERDLSILDYRVQKCRSRRRTVIESDDTRAKFRGRTLADLIRWFEPEDLAFRGESMGFPQDTLGLIEAVARSGIKTIAVTEAAWGETLGSLAATPANADPNAADAP